ACFCRDTATIEGRVGALRRDPKAWTHADRKLYPWGPYGNQGMRADRGHRHTLRRWNTADLHHFLGYGQHAHQCRPTIPSRDRWEDRHSFVARPYLLVAQSQRLRACPKRHEFLGHSSLQRSRGRLITDWRSIPDQALPDGAIACRTAGTGDRLV